MSKKLLIKNSFFGILQFALTAILALISVPIFIHNLGMQTYGVYAVISIIGNFNALTNFGLNGALLVFLAKQGKSRELDHDIIVTQIIVGTISLLFIISVFFFRDFIILNVFSVPELYLSESKNLLFLLTCSSVILTLGQPFTAIIDSKQKIFISKICQFVYSLIYWGGMILVVSLGGHLTSIGEIALISAVVWFFMVLFIAGRIWGKLDLTGLFFNFKKTAKKQFSYGSKIYMAAMTGFMLEPFSKVLLSNFVGFQGVGLYEIGIKIKNQIGGFFSTALYPLLPFIANNKIDSSLNNRLFDFSKKVQLIVIPVAILLVFVLPILTKYWLGSEDYLDSSIFIIILTTSMLLFSTTIQPIYLYLEAKNKADKNVWIQLLSVTINTIVFFIFYKITGLYTILLSNSLGLLASYILGNYYQQKYLEVNLKKESSYYLKLLIFGLVSFSLCFLIRYFIVVSLWDLLIFPVIIGTSFMFFVHKQKIISEKDLELYFTNIPFVKNKLSKLLKV